MHDSLQGITVSDALNNVAFSRLVVAASLDVVVEASTDIFLLARANHLWFARETESKTACCRH
jgi:hypothetical protein